MVANAAEDIARSDPKLFWMAYLSPLIGGAITFLLLFSATTRKLRPRGTGWVAT
jgi:hypothetical protein